MNTKRVKVCGWPAKRSDYLVRFCISVALMGIFSSVSKGQQSVANWQTELRSRVEAQDWTGAMRIVDRESAQVPHDMDVKAWRARILGWSGQLTEAEHEYLEIVSAVPNDPDHWIGLATVYSREGQMQNAIRAANRAVELDPKRADLRIVRGRMLRATGDISNSKVDFEKALDLDPKNSDARAAVKSFRRNPKHELRFAVNTDLFSFANVNHDSGVSLTSRWTPSWQTTLAGDFYQIFRDDAGKFVVSVRRSLPRWGGFTLGGATARDHGVIPKREAFFTYDDGWKLSEGGLVRGVEIVYAHHWYWYSTARIMTINGSMILYFPHEWIWSVGITEARSHFSGTNAEWLPSGMTRLGFPITEWGGRRLGGSLFFATGIENFAQVNQLGQFSSHTYGGGLRLQLTSRQDITASEAYQKRTQNRTETSFGFTYGIHF